MVSRRTFLGINWLQDALPSGGSQAASITPARVAAAYKRALSIGSSAAPIANPAVNAGSHGFFSIREIDLRKL
jgi:hypothetical protein